MKTATDTTSPTIEAYQNQITQLEQQVQELDLKLKWYEEQFRLSQQKRFGASSEQTHPVSYRSLTKLRRRLTLHKKSLQLKRSPIVARSRKGSVRPCWLICLLRRLNIDYRKKNKAVRVVGMRCMKSAPKHAKSSK